MTKCAPERPLRHGALPSVPPYHTPRGLLTSLPCLLEMLTLDLKKSNDNLVVHGKLIIYLSTNVSQPISNPGPSQVSGVTEALNNLSVGPSTNASSTNLASSGSLSRTPSATAPSSSTQEATVTMPIPQVSPTPEAEQTQPAASLPVCSGGSIVSTPPAQAAAITNACATAQTASNNNAQSRNFNPHEDQYGPLPQGWERRIDPLGRTYYVDHNTRTTT